MMPMMPQWAISEYPSLVSGVSTRKVFSVNITFFFFLKLKLITLTEIGLALKERLKGTWKWPTGFGSIN